jgi:hypothetical protein
VPQWREINRHPQWLAWLQQTDTYSRVKRQRLLDDAVEKGDANRVIKFFQGFLAESAWLQGQAQPANAGGRPAASGQTTYTREQILQMADRRRKGVINDTDWAAWERELIRAGAEGRVVGALPLDGSR